MSKKYKTTEMSVYTLWMAGMSADVCVCVQFGLITSACLSEKALKKSSIHFVDSNVLTHTYTQKPTDAKNGL